MQAEPSVAVVIANNLPAILMALAPIIGSIVTLVIAYFNLKAKLAETRDTTNKLIATTKALRDNALDSHQKEFVSYAKSTGNATIPLNKPQIPEVPEKLS